VDQALAKDVEELKHDVWGNGKPGLVADVRDIKRALYRNENTGSPGLIRDVTDSKEMVTEMRGVGRFGKAAVAIIGGLLVIIQLADKLGFFAGS